MAQTLIVVKPDAVNRGLVGEFLSRFERMGLEIKAIRIVREDETFWNQFYPSELDWFENVGKKTLQNCTERNINVRARLGTDDPAEIGKKVKGWLVTHMSSGDAVAVVLEGNEAPTKVRIACGATLPNVASPGTIRFDYSCDSPALANDESRSLYNLIHASDPNEARGGDPALIYEIRLMFPDIALGK